MDIDAYLQVVRRWLALVVILPVVAAAAAFFIVAKQPPSYTANVQLLVGPTVSDPSSNINILHASTQVMQTYSALATTHDLMKQIIDQQQLKQGPSELAGSITATPNTTTGVLGIAVHLPNQKQAVAVANAVANGLVNMHVDNAGNTTSSDSDLSAQAKQLRDQIAASQARINDLNAALKAVNSTTNQPIIDEQKKIDGLEAQLNAPPDPAVAQQIQDHQTRIKQLQATLKSTVNLDAQNVILNQLAREDAELAMLTTGIKDNKTLLVNQLGQERNLLASMDTGLAQQQNQIVGELGVERAQLANAQHDLTTVSTQLQNAVSSQITLINPAINASQDQSKAPLIAGIAGVAGLILALTIAFTFAYFDDRVRTPVQLSKVTGAPVWESIGPSTALLQSQDSGLASPMDLRVSEAFRRLCIKLAPDGSPKVCSLLLSDLDGGQTSPQVAANLAITLARAGQRIILIDANLRQPALDTLFQLSYSKGVREWLSHKTDEPVQARIEWAPGLTVIPAGATSGNSIQELAWTRMEELLERAQNEADMVIVSGPSLSTSADGIFLALHLGGVLAVAQKGQTHWKQAAETAKNLHSLDVHILGMVVTEPGKIRFKTLPGPRSNGQAPQGKRPPTNAQPDQASQTAKA